MASSATYQSAQTDANTIRDGRLGELQWREIKNKWGRTSWVIDRTDAPDWFIQLFVQHADSDGRLYEQEGVYYYKMTSDAIFKNLKQTKSTATPAVRQQRLEDRESFDGSSAVTKTDFQQRQADIKQAHDENMLSSKAVVESNYAVARSNNRVAEAIENQNRLKQIELGQNEIEK